MRHSFLLLPVLVALSSTFLHSQAPFPKAAPGSAEDYMNRGIAADDKQNYDEAIADFTKAIQISPQNAGAYYGRGDAEFRKKDFKSSIDDYTTAIKILPGYKEAFYSRGEARFISKDLDGAEADYNKAIELEPKYPEPYHGRGNVRYSRGDYDAAIAEYTKAININPKYALAYTLRGNIKMAQGKDTEANADFEIAIRLDSAQKSFVERLKAANLKDRASKAAGDSASTSTSHSTSSPSVKSPVSLEFNVNYSCGSERMMISRCRKDSDQPGFPPTTPDQDYCQVYYPDRPKRGGFDASAVELRAEVIKKLQTCTR
jgi:tetratricopeptide (TPR) repeat protein